MKRRKQLASEIMLPGLAYDLGAKAVTMEQLAEFDPAEPKRFFVHPHGEIWAGDAIVWLRSLPDSSVDLIFADPPYNIKKAEWANSISVSRSSQAARQALAWRQ